MKNAYNRLTVLYPLFLALLFMVQTPHAHTQCTFTPTTVGVSGNGLFGFTYTVFPINYVPNGTLNGAPKWENQNFANYPFRLVWTGTVWQFQLMSNGVPVAVVAQNNTGSSTSLPCSPSGWIDPSGEYDYFNPGGLTLSGGCGSLAPPVLTPQVSITADPGSNIEAGDAVTFTATPTHGGTTPSYQWRVNGDPVGTNSPNYMSSTLADGDVVTVQMTSSDPCAVPPTATSNAVEMTAVCPITGISLYDVNPVDCNTTTCTTDDIFIADVIVAFASIPASGTLSLTGSGIVGNVPPVDVAGLTGNSHTFTEVAMYADGSSVELSATFSEGCTYTDDDVITAPQCDGSDCSITDIEIDNTSPCSNNNTTAATDDYFTTDVTVTFAFAPAGQTLVLTDESGAVLATQDVDDDLLCTSTWTFEGVQLPANGLDVVLTAAFEDFVGVTGPEDEPCTYTSGTLMTAPESCSGSVISGKVVWEHDLETPVADVAVALTGAATDNDITNFDGTYAVVGGGNITITPTKTDTPRQGVDAADVTRIRQHALGTALFNNGYKVLAADVNENNAVTNADATIIQQALLGNAGAGNLLDNPSWRFVDSAYVFATPNAPWSFPAAISLTGVTAAVPNASFVGVKMGDVNGTWGAPPALTAQPAVWLVADENLEAGTTHRVAFALGENLPDVAAWQFALRFNPAYAAVTHITPKGILPLTREDFGVENLRNGELRTVFAQAQGQPLKAGEVVFELELTVRRSALLSEVLQLDNDLLDGRVYDTTLKGGAVKLAFAPVRDKPGLPTAPTYAEAAFELYQNVPNPFADETVIAFSLPTDATATITVQDISGRVVARLSGDYAAGYNTVRLTRDVLNGATGVMTYTITAGTHTATRRMVVVE